MDGYQVWGHCCVCQRDRTRERTRERENERGGGKGLVQQRERMPTSEGETSEGERRRREGGYEGARGGGGGGGMKERRRGAGTQRDGMSVCVSARVMCHL